MDTIGTGFNTPTAIAFLPGGRMLVAEKRGRVYTLLNGVKSTNPIWSREAEVLNHHDRGLLGIAVDPSYVSNRYLYFLYTVDPDSNGTDSNDDAFGRITRYQVSATDSTTVDYSTRTVLMGVSWRYGPVSCSPSHTIGSLRFGIDGSLLVSCGDGASYTTVDAGGLDNPAFGSGANRTDPYEDIGAFRSQSLSSLCGKILRINPANGHGYSSNPYWDGTATSVRSRVWAYGLRNPFRFGVRPGTGSTNPADGDPGTVYVGDVGWDNWEDQNVVRTPGRNFGWPCYEGANTQPGYQGASPPHNGCGSFGQPDNPASNSAPDMWWNHWNASLSNPSGRKGNAAVGGAFYTGASYPSKYQGRYFFADFGQSWIQVATYNGGDQLTAVELFGTNMDSPVDMVADPVSGDIHYVAISAGQVRRIRWTGAGLNQPPVAVANGTPTSGVAPLGVTFSSTGSYDPNGDALGYSWNFGDGGTSTSPSPSHTYNTAGSYAAVLTVSDGKGGTGRDTVNVLVSGSGSSFPTTIVRDDFNRPNGGIGGAWVGQTSSFQIQSQQLAQVPGYGSVIWNGAVFGNSQECYVTLAALTGSSTEHNLMLKVQGTSWDAGHIEVDWDITVSRLAVNTYHPSQGWRGHGSLQPVTFAPGDRIGARALADGTVEVYKNATKLGAWSVTTWPSYALGGRIGLTLENATSSRLDNFGGGDVVFASNTPPTAILSSPAPGSFYAEGDTIWLEGDGTDAEDQPAQLSYDWRVDLHHNTHVHPSTFVSEQQNDFIIGENHDDGTGIHLVANLIVTDTGGKSDTASVAIYPEVDLLPEDLIVYPAWLYQGIPANYEFAIENSGRMPSPYVHWSLLAGTSILAQGDTLVPPLGRVVVQRRLPSPAVGLHTLRAVVDSAETLVETSETNNAAAIQVTVSAPPTAVGDAPAVLALSAPHPNPASGAVSMSLELPVSETVRFEVFDLQGRAVWESPSRAIGPGHWTLTWPGTDRGHTPAQAGIYLARITVGNQEFLRRFVRIR